jgi:hypothetical protein
LRNVYFGAVTDPNTVDANGDGRIDGAIINGQVVETEHPVWGGKVITDLSVAYNLLNQQNCRWCTISWISILILTLDLQPQSDQD